MEDKKKEVAEIEENIPADVNDILQELPEEKRNAIVATMMAIQEERSFSGPLPPPDYLAEYEKTLPGAPDRIMTMAEKQVDHRIDMEKTIATKKFRQSTMGQIIGAVLILFFGYIAYDLAMNGHENVAMAIGVTTVVSLAVIFVLNKMPNIFPRKNSEE